MKIFYHGSPFLFESFNLDSLSEGSGIKFGAGIYLTESYNTAVRYSAPRKMETVHHYVYTLEVPDKTDLNYLPYPSKVQDEIIDKVEKALQESLPQAAKLEGKLLRKYLAKRLTGTPKEKLVTEKQIDTKPTTLEGELKTSKLLLELGVLFIEWPQGAWGKYPDGLMNVAVLDPEVIRIVKIEEVERVKKGSEYIAASRREIKMSNSALV